MPIAYNNPGVTISESVNPSQVSLLASPQVICLVGTATGTQTAAERLILSGTTAVTLKNTGVVVNSVVVTDGITGTVINAGNYTLAAGTDPTTGTPDPVVGDEPETIARNTQPSTAPTAATGTGTLTGTYTYAYSFINAGGETGVSTTSNQVTLAAQGASLSGILVGPAGTTARGIYRAKVVGGIVGTYNQVATLANNSATTLANESLSDVAAAANPSPQLGIADGGTVVVTYTYTDQNYYAPTTFSNYNDVIAKYGAPYDANGNISSQLTYAARLAFVNGASSLLLLAARSSSSIDFTSAFLQLVDNPDVRVIAAISGDPNVHSALSAHIATTYGQSNWRVGIIGQDSSTATIANATLRTAAQAFNNEGIVMVSPASFKILNPITNLNVNVGAQYMTAAIAGMLAARDPQVPLTRKVVAGFTGPNDLRTQNDYTLDSSAGLFVVEVRSNTILRVRHAITTAVGNINTRELSVIRSKYEMAHQVRDALDASIIGLTVPQSQVASFVSTAVVGILERLVNQQLISAYQNVQARLLASDPTTVEVRFEFTPIYPLDNINIIFTINANTGDFGVTF